MIGDAYENVSNRIHSTGNEKTDVTSEIASGSKIAIKNELALFKNSSLKLSK